MAISAGTPNASGLRVSILAFSSEATIRSPCGILELGTL